MNGTCVTVCDYCATFGRIDKTRGYPIRKCVTIVPLLTQLVIRDMTYVNDTSSKFGTFSFQPKIAVMGFWIWIWIWVQVIIPCSYSPYLFLPIFVEYDFRHGFGFGFD